MPVAPAARNAGIGKTAVINDQRQHPLLDFIASLAALVPKPRVNLTRFHGIFAPNSKHRALVTPAKRGTGNKTNAATQVTARVNRGRVVACLVVRFGWNVSEERKIFLDEW